MSMSTCCETVRSTSIFRSFNNTSNGLDFSAAERCERRTLERLQYGEHAFSNQEEISICVVCIRLDAESVSVLQDLLSDFVSNSSRVLTSHPTSWSCAHHALVEIRERQLLTLADGFDPTSFVRHTKSERTI